MQLLRGKDLIEGVLEGRPRVGLLLAGGAGPGGQLRRTLLEVGALVLCQWLRYPVGRKRV